MITTVLLIFGGLQWIGSQSNRPSATNTAPQTSESQSKPSKSSSSTVTSQSSSSKPRVTHAKAASQNNELSMNRNTLTDLSHLRAEQVSTISNREVTFSEFWENNGNWYWTLSSDQRGSFENAKITAVTKQGNQYQMNAVTTTAPKDVHLVLNVVKMAGGYELQTDFQHIHGIYDNGQSVDKVSDHGSDLLSDHSEQATEGKLTRDNHEVTYSDFYQASDGWHWRLHSKERGTIEDGRIRAVKTYDDMPYLYITSAVDPNQTKYVLQFDVHKNGEYWIQTNYQHLEGQYLLP